MVFDPNVTADLARGYRFSALDVLGAVDVLKERLPELDVCVSGERQTSSASRF